MHSVVVFSQTCSRHDTCEFLLSCSKTGLIKIYVTQLIFVFLNTFFQSEMVILFVGKTNLKLALKHVALQQVLGEELSFMIAS